jgi:hypothetical protein
MLNTTWSTKKSFNAQSHDHNQMHIAQLNIARARQELDQPLMKEFVDNLEPINGIADASPGFVWRLQDESGDATSIQLFDDPLVIVNMSVWESIDALKNFLFKTHHLDFLKRREEWFEKLDESSHVLWRIEPGHIPGLEEARLRLEHLRTNGESGHAFSFRGKAYH